MSWTGTCHYDVQTRWAANLPHIIELTAEDAEWSIRVQGRRSPPDGPVTLSPEGREDYLVLVMDRAFVIGAVNGTLETSRRGDSMFLEIEGEKVYRDTVPLRASCRMGPVAAGGSESSQ